jgi:hypothetical protein
MVPKVFTDAGYTAVGLGVLAAQQVQTRRRKTRSRVTDQIQASRQGIESAVGQVRARIEPIQAKLDPVKAKLDPVKAKLDPVKAKLEAPVSAALGRLPRLPGPLGGLLVSSRDRVQAALRPQAEEKQPPARHATQGKAEKAAPPAPADS